MMDKLHTRAPERKISAEVDSLEQAMLVAEAGIDIVQCEKFACELLAETVGSVRAVRDIVILAAGGINGEKRRPVCRHRRRRAGDQLAFFWQTGRYQGYNGKIPH